MSTHYLPAFTVVRARLQMAACGTFIRETEHATEPTCPRCLAYVMADAQDEAAIFSALGYIELRPGVMGPPPPEEEA